MKPGLPLNIQKGRYTSVDTLQRIMDGIRQAQQLRASGARSAGGVLGGSINFQTPPVSPSDCVNAVLHIAPGVTAYPCQVVEIVVAISASAADGLLQINKLMTARLPPRVGVVLCGVLTPEGGPKTCNSLVQLQYKGIAIVEYDGSGGEVDNTDRLGAGVVSAVAVVDPLGPLQVISHYATWEGRYYAMCDITGRRGGGVLVKGVDIEGEFQTIILHLKDDTTRFTDSVSVLDSYGQMQLYPAGTSPTTDDAQMNIVVTGTHTLDLQPETGLAGTRQISGYYLYCEDPGPADLVLKSSDFRSSLVTNVPRVVGGAILIGESATAVDRGYGILEVWDGGAWPEIPPCLWCDEGPCIKTDQGVCTNCDEGYCINGDLGPCIGGDFGVCTNRDLGACTNCDEGMCLAGDNGICRNADVGGPCVEEDSGPCTHCDEGPCSNLDYGLCTNCDEGFCLLGDGGKCISTDVGDCTLRDKGPCINGDRGKCTASDVGFCYTCDEGACTHGDQGPCTVCDQGPCSNGDQGKCLYGDNGKCASADVGGGCVHGDHGLCLVCDEGPCITSDHPAGGCRSCDEGGCTDCDEGGCSSCDQGPCIAGDNGPCTNCDEGICSGGDLGVCSNGDHGPCTNCDQTEICTVDDAGPVGEWYCWKITAYDTSLHCAEENAAYKAIFYVCVEGADPPVDPASLPCFFTTAWSWVAAQELQSGPHDSKAVCEGACTAPASGWRCCTVNEYYGNVEVPNTTCAGTPDATGVQTCLENPYVGQCVVFGVYSSLKVVTVGETEYGSFGECFSACPG